MKKKNVLHYTGLSILLLLIITSGCASSKSAGINAAIKDVEIIEKFKNNRYIYNIKDFDGVALLSISKVGAVGVGLMGASASVYMRNPDTNEFGPPSFVTFGGVSIGLAYAGINLVDCLLLFRNQEDVTHFAKKGGLFNFSNEASFGNFGRKQMTIPKANRYTDGAGLAIGAVELEFLVGGPRDSLHHNMYQVDATVDKILLGDVQVPEELKIALEKLNVIMN